MPVMGSKPTSRSISGDSSANTMSTRDTSSTSPSSQSIQTQTRANQEREEAIARVREAAQERAEYRQYWKAPVRQTEAPTFQNVMRKNATANDLLSEFKNELAAWESGEYTRIYEADVRAGEKQAAQHKFTSMYHASAQQEAYVEGKRAAAQAAADLAQQRAIEKAKFETMVENRFIRQSSALAESKLAKYRQQTADQINTVQMGRDIAQARSIMGESLKTVPYQPEAKKAAIARSKEYYDQWEEERKAIEGQQTRAVLGISAVPVSLPGGTTAYLSPANLIRGEPVQEITSRSMGLVDNILAGYSEAEAQASAWVKARTPGIPDEDALFYSVLAGQQATIRAPRAWHEFSTQYSIDFYSELREKPLYAGSMLAITAMLFPIGRGIGFLGRTAPVARVLGYVPPAVKTGAAMLQTGAAYGIGIGYFGSVGYRTVTDDAGNLNFTPRQMGGSLGGITSTELLPMTVGAYAGSKITNYAADLFATRGLTEIPMEVVISEDILSGRAMFPTARAGEIPPSKVIRLYEGAGIRVGLDPSLVGGYHATPIRFTSPAIVQAGPRFGGEGLHIAPEPSPYFLGVSEEVYSIFPHSLFPTGSRPGVMFVTPTKITRIPKGARGSYHSMAEWFNAQARPGVAYVTPKYEVDWKVAERETEAMITVGSGLVKVGDLGWFRFKGRRIILENWMTADGIGGTGTGTGGSVISLPDIAGLSEYQASRIALTNPIAEIGSLSSGTRKTGSSRSSRPGSSRSIADTYIAAYRYKPPKDEYRAVFRYRGKAPEYRYTPDYEPGFRRTPDYRYVPEYTPPTYRPPTYRPPRRPPAREPPVYRPPTRPPTYRPPRRPPKTPPRTPPFVPPFDLPGSKTKPRGAAAAAHRRDIFHSVATSREMLWGGQGDLLAMPATVESKRQLNAYKKATSAELEKTLPKGKTIKGSSRWKPKNTLKFDSPLTRKTLIDDIVYGEKPAKKKKPRRRRIK